MGVQGLAGLVKNSAVLEGLEFGNSHVVIDGPNLYYSLYVNCEPKLDQRHGGDYSAFRDEVGQFFDNLKDCDIKPLVILDGGSEAKKEETIMSRLTDKLKNAKSISESKSDHSKIIIPPLVKDVFIQILKEKQIELEVCFGEADLTAALRANQRKCPVLSNDSDFYIFNLQEGFLPLNNFNWKDVRNQRIPAKLYRISKFCSKFKVDPNLMPVFAAVSGNDFSRLEDNGNFVKTYPVREQTYWKEARQKAILGFLGTLNGKTSEEAVRGALRQVGKPEQDIKPFQDSVESYTLREPPVLELPQWIIEAVRTGELTSFVTTVLTEKKMTLPPLVEDFSQPSSYKAALQIRRYFYGLLVGTETCTEYDREDPGPGPGPGPVVRANRVMLVIYVMINQISLQASMHLRQNILFEALKVSTERSSTENVPDHLKLPFRVTQFWFEYRQQNHPGPVNQFCLQALLLGFLPDQPGAQLMHHHVFAAGGAFKREMDGLKAKAGPLQLDVTHAFSQWQCCMRQSLYLNQLLKFPLQEPQYSRKKKKKKKENVTTQSIHTIQWYDRRDQLLQYKNTKN
uniref:Asteroid domain-containing protein n=1 Tax=Kryptolebias marmoratus TaxID=37003 RepID=A0A3Q2ZT92_KRYMA